MSTLFQQQPSLRRATRSRRADTRVAIADSGGANIGSVVYALERLGVPASLTADAEQIRDASHVILPGVGAAGPAMRYLRERGLDALIRELRQPVLGICLGMQLLFESTAEGDVACLGILPGRAERLVPTPGLRVPHMGWNRLEILVSDPLLRGFGANDYAYFVHSYALPVSSTTLAVADHGGRFAAVARAGNFCAAQFHPERSAGVGARLLKNFLEL